MKKNDSQWPTSTLKQVGSVYLKGGAGMICQDNRKRLSFVFGKSISQNFSSKKALLAFLKDKGGGQVEFFGEKNKGDKFFNIHPARVRNNHRWR